MKIKIIIISILTISTMLFSSCYSSRPAADKTSSPDYNKRVSVSGAHNIKRGNALNVTFQVGLIGVGAYGGYNMDLIKHQTENGREPVRVANAAVGALVGAGLGFLFDYVAGKNTKNYNVDSQKWIRKANKEYLLLDKGYSSDFRIIHPSAEMAYAVKDIQDVRDFQTMFPNSSYTEKVVSSGIQNLTRDDLPKLLKIYSGTSQTNEIKQKYLLASNSIEECIEVAQTYSELQNEAEIRALGMVNNVQTVQTFSSNFSKDKNEDALFRQCVDEKISSNEEIIAMFPNNAGIEKLKDEILLTLKTSTDIHNFVNKYPTFDKNNVVNIIGNQVKFHSYDDYRVVSQCLINYGNEIISNNAPFLNVIHNHNNIGAQVMDLQFLFPNLNEKTKSIIQLSYEMALKTSDHKIRHKREYNEDPMFYEVDGYEYKVKPSAKELKALLDEYKNRPDYNNILANAKNEYEYRTVIEQSRTDKYAEYAKKHPEKFNEMDELAYKKVSVYNSSSIDEYVRYFPNGKYVKIVMGKIPEAKAYEAKREEERMNEKCRTCNGNGLCPNCNGVRKTECSLCYGKGWYEEFNLFSANEIKNCYRCSGTGWERCNRCSGTGKCHHCHGSTYQNR